MAEINGTPVALAPPQDYVVDFENPTRNSVEAQYAVSAVGILLSTAFFAQRLYVKGFLRGKLWFDDLLLGIAYAGAIAIQALVIRSNARGYMGVHAWEIDLVKYQDFAFYAGYINSVVYAIPVTFSKLTILLFYREINNQHTWYRICVHVMLVVVAGSGVGIFVSSLIPCQPFRKAWDISFPPDEGSCIDLISMYQATAALGVATDVLIIAIPIPMVLRLRMSMSKKVGLLILFAIGSATVITSMVRLELLISSFGKDDQTWEGGRICVWICIEANLLIMCASVNTLRHFVQAVAPRLLSSTGGGNSSKRSSKPLSSAHELRTFGAGSSRSRAYYNRFDEADVGTDTVVDIQGMPSPDRKQGVVGEQKSQEDDGSEQGIVQTKETRVYYEAK